jgi:hypothetical protein
MRCVSVLFLDFIRISTHFCFQGLKIENKHSLDKMPKDWPGPMLQGLGPEHLCRYDEKEVGEEDQGEICYLNCYQFLTCQMAI